jgi:hypothetical protein
MFSTRGSLSSVLGYYLLGLLFDPEDCSSAAWLRTPDTPDTTYGYKIPGYGRVRFVFHSSESSGRCSREVQIRISFGVACCHVLLEVNIFFEFKVTNAARQSLAR